MKRYYVVYTIGLYSLKTATVTGYNLDTSDGIMRLSKDLGENGIDAIITFFHKVSSEGKPLEKGEYNCTE